MLDRNIFIHNLNGDLRREYEAVLSYQTYAAALTGAETMELREEFMDEAHEELEHAQYLADKIVVLGGTISVNITNPPHMISPREMIQQLLFSEREAVERYSRRAEEARALEMHGAAVEIEEILMDETGHMNRLQMLLR